jgi:hypothetical protein
MIRATGTDSNTVQPSVLCKHFIHSITSFKSLPVFESQSRENQPPHTFPQNEKKLQSIYARSMAASQPQRPALRMRLNLVLMLNDAALYY